MSRFPLESTVDRILREKRERDRLFKDALGPSDRLSELAAGRDSVANLISAAGGVESIIERGNVARSLVEQAGGASAIMQRAEEAISARMALEKAWEPIGQDYAHSLRAISEHGERMQRGLSEPLSAIAAYQRAEVDKISKAMNEAFGSLHQQATSISAAISRIQSPLIRIEAESASASALARLAEIGTALNKISPFDESLASSLRASFGDWRDLTLPDEQLLADPIVRQTFYRDTGYDAALVDFPAEGFEEVLEVTEICPVDESEESEEIAIEIFRALRRIERELRNLIVDVLVALEGENWERTALPNNMRDEWVAKREKALANGESDAPLIHFADFTDYIRIIRKKNLWKQGFQTIFSRESDIQESLLRLGAIRIPDAHARIVTQDDLLLVRVEGKRILRATRRSSQ